MTPPCAARAIAWSLPFVLAGCGVFGLSQTEQEQLAFFQQNAGLYYEGGRYSQALDAVRRGLEISPDDYKLKMIEGWCYLRQGDDDPRLLPRAEEIFDQVCEQRSEDEQHEAALLGHGTVHKMLGVLHRRRAAALREEADQPQRSAGEKTVRAAEAQEHEVRATYHLQKATKSFEELVKHEQQLHVAYKHLMDIAAEYNRYDAAVAAGEECLRYNLSDQAALQKVIDATMSVRDEREKRVRFQDLVDQEMRVRTALAEMHFRAEKYEAAIGQLDAILAKDPTRSIDYYNRATALEKLGRTDDAERDFEKFLSSTKLPVGHEKVTRAFEFTRATEAARHRAAPDRDG
jgi:tetratricopeptide (TPR) repeat protein